jgi:hypothetical protein
MNRAEDSASFEGYASACPCPAAETNHQPPRSSPNRHSNSATTNTVPVTNNQQQQGVRRANRRFGLKVKWPARESFRSLDATPFRLLVKRAAF